MNNRKLTKRERRALTIFNWRWWLGVPVVVLGGLLLALAGLADAARMILDHHGNWLMNRMAQWMYLKEKVDA